MTLSVGQGNKLYNKFKVQQCVNIITKCEKGYPIENTNKGWRIIVLIGNGWLVYKFADENKFKGEYQHNTEGHGKEHCIIIIIVVIIIIGK